MFCDVVVKDSPIQWVDFIRSVVSQLLLHQKATVQVLKTTAKWYGVTYKEDKPVVEKAIENMKQQGIYTSKLWGESDE